MLVHPPSHLPQTIPPTPRKSTLQCPTRSAPRSSRRYSARRSTFATSFFTLRAHHATLFYAPTARPTTNDVIPSRRCRLCRQSAICCGSAALQIKREEPAVMFPPLLLISAHRTKQIPFSAPPKFGRSLSAQHSTPSTGSQLLQNPQKPHFQKTPFSENPKIP